MSDPLADSTERLERLLEQATKEVAREKCDARCTEIWQVRVNANVSKTCHPGLKKMRSGPSGVLDEPLRA